MTRKRFKDKSMSAIYENFSKSTHCKLLSLQLIKEIYKKFISIDLTAIHSMYCFLFDTKEHYLQTGGHLPMTSHHDRLDCTEELLSWPSPGGGESNMAAPLSLAVEFWRQN